MSFYIFLLILGLRELREVNSAAGIFYYTKL